MSIEIIALIIFVITYIGIIFTRLPKINIDRPSAAFIGSVAMMCLGVISFEQAVDFIDFNTIIGNNSYKLGNSFFLKHVNIQNVMNNITAYFCCYRF